MLNALKTIWTMPATVVDRWRERFSHDWQPHGDKMRRWRNGKWEYRQMTDKEDLDMVAYRDW